MIEFLLNNTIRNFGLEAIKPNYICYVFNLSRISNERIMKELKKYNHKYLIDLKEFLEGFIEYQNTINKFRHYKLIYQYGYIFHLDQRPISTLFHKRLTISGYIDVCESISIISNYSLIIK